MKRLEELEWDKLTEAEFDEITEQTMRDIVAPEVINTLQQTLDDLKRRIRVMQKLPPGTPDEVRQIYEPYLQEKLVMPDSVALPEGWNLWTQDGTFFHILYFQEWIELMLRKASIVRLIQGHPSLPDFLSELPPNVSDLFKRQLPVRLDEDVEKCVAWALPRFIHSLRGRLGTIIYETVQELVTNAINELLPTLNNDAQITPSELRARQIDHWIDVEKARIGTPNPGRQLDSGFYRSKEHFIEDLKEARRRLEPQGLHTNQRAVAEEMGIADKTLSRYLERFELKDVFPKLGNRKNMQKRKARR